MSNINDNVVLLKILHIISGERIFNAFEQILISNVSFSHIFLSVVSVQNANRTS